VLKFSTLNHNWGKLLDKNSKNATKSRSRDQKENLISRFFSSHENFGIEKYENFPTTRTKDCIN